MCAGCVAAVDLGGAESQGSAQAVQRTANEGVIVYGTSFEVGPNYEVVSPIGQGAYGVVVAARVVNQQSSGDQSADEGSSDSEDGADENQDEIVAIKKIVLHGFTAGMIRRTLREIKILRLLQHENCLTLLTVLPPPSREEFKEIYLVTNLMPTNLQAEISKARKMKESGQV